jgi:hypothetical protein
MRFVVFVKATKDSEANIAPDPSVFEEMSKFNEQLVKAGIMLSGDGLHPSAKGARINFKGKERLVVDGPFAETKELVAGFWIWQCKSMQEAIDWAKRCPNPTGTEGTLEIRQIMELADFGDALPQHVKDHEEQLRREIGQK